MKKLAALFLVSVSMQLIGMEILENYDPSVQGRAEQEEMPAPTEAQRMFIEEPQLQRELKEQELQQSPQGFGWNINNSTGRPLSFAWYKTRTYRAPTRLFKSYPWGFKEQISRSETVEPDTSRFMVLPVLPEQQGEWRGHTLWRQFIATYHPELLTGTIQVDSYGLPTNPQLILFNEWDFPKAYEAGTEGAHLIFGRTPGTDEIRIITEKAKGWFFENTTEYTVYCRWYVAKWNQQKRVFSDLSFLDQQIVEIAPGQKQEIFYPILKPASVELRLLFAFNESSLRNESPIDKHDKLLPGIISRTQQELGPFATNWQIVYEDGAPTLQPLNYTIKVNNTTNKTLYCAMYYVDTIIGTAQKYGPAEYITQIQPQHRRAIAYPSTNRAGSIQLAVASEENKDLLKKINLSVDDMKRLYFKDFAKTNLWNWWLQGDFDILYNPGEPQGIKISSVGGGAFERTVRKMQDINVYDDQLIREFEAKFQDKNPLYLPDEEIKYALGRESVIVGFDNLTKEHEFVRQRLNFVRIALNSFLGEEVIKEGQPVPRIALVFSGGGWRAMTETIGYLEGAANTKGGNVLNCTTYMNGLSGSTWAINPLVVSNLTPERFAKEQRTKVGKGVGYVLPSLNTLISDLIYKSSSYVERRFIESRYGQIHGPVGFYGHALAHSLLEGFTLNGKTSHQITLSDMRTVLDADPAKYPLPLSVATDQGTHEKEILWVEFSPYYIGTHQKHRIGNAVSGGWIDSKLFGSKFIKGIPVHIAPEYPLAQYLGTWGSAFAISDEDIKKVSTPAAMIYRTFGGIGSAVNYAYTYLVGTVPPERTCPQRLTVAEYPNYSYHFSYALPDLFDRKSLCLVDAGITKIDFRHNLATIPSLYRNVDMVILCDSNESPSTDKYGEHLFASAAEAKARSLPFPDLIYESMHKKAVDTLFKDTSSLFIEENKPVVVYMQCKKNALYDTELLKSENPSLRTGFDPDASNSPNQFTATTNFNYTPEQFDLLSGLTKSIFIQSKNNIKEGILEVIKRQQHK